MKKKKKKWKSWRRHVDDEAYCCLDLSIIKLSVSNPNLPSRGLVSYFCIGSLPLSLSHALSLSLDWVLNLKTSRPAHLLPFIIIFLFPFAVYKHVIPKRLNYGDTVPFPSWVGVDLLLMFDILVHPYMFNIFDRFDGMEERCWIASRARGASAKRPHHAWGVCKQWWSNRRNGRYLDCYFR